MVRGLGMNPALRFWARSSRRKKALMVGFGVLVVAVLAGFLGAEGEASQPNRNGVHIVASRSWCSATGIDDARSGTGHVTFFLALANGGERPRTVSATPVRYDDDGRRSLLRAVRFTVGRERTSLRRTPSFAYKAYEHNVVGCSVELGGNETAIEVR
jgi:hypothetical protein